MAIQYQSLNFKGRKGMSAAQSREHQRAWSERGWSMALEKGNFDRSREHLNFEIVDGKIKPIDKTRTIGERLATNLAVRGIKDPNAGLAKPMYRTVGDFVFSGTHERMTEIAFGDQPVVIKKGDNKENLAIHRTPEAEQWAMDIYNFVCGKYGKENVISFYVHLDETSMHCHAAVVPVRNGRIDFKGVFVGKDKIEYSRRIAALHDELAEVNKPWGLERGTSLTNEKGRGKQTQDYRRSLEKDSREKELELAEMDAQLADALHEVKMANTRVKGLTTMVENKTNEKKLLEAKLKELNRQIKNTDGDKTALEEQVAEVQADLDKTNTDLAEKQQKLEQAKADKTVAEDELKTVKESVAALRTETNKLADILKSNSGTMVKEGMLDMCITEFRRMRAELPPETMAAFNGSYLEYLAENANAMLRCAVLLFGGYVNDATTFAEGHGGGGGGSDLPWGRDEDEDDRRWARRCVARANQMMRPATRGRKR